MPLQHTHTLIIGASISGLACAASLQKRDIEYTIIEKQDQVAAPWRNHYHRLHLHTNKRQSHLPYKKFKRKVARYPARQDVVEYLDDYKKAFGIDPIFNTEAISVKKEGAFWNTETNNGFIQSKYLILATGAFGRPKPVQFPGMESFPGKILHSYDYKSGRDFRGQHVLVVGFGNSACEIAMDLYEQGAMPAMSVRSPVNVIPRDVLGIPVIELSVLLNRLPAKFADALTGPLVNGLIGDITKLGLRKKQYGPLEEIRKDGTVPLLDIGTIRHIREGHIKIYGGIHAIEGASVHFTDGEKENFNAIVAGIGYYRDYANFVHVDASRFEDLRVPTRRQKYFGKDGLYFCGYWVSPTGQIHEIALDAVKIARDIAKRR